MTKSLRDINARDIVNMTEDEVFALEKGVDLSISFADKVMVATRKSTIYTWYLWHIHRMFRNVPIHSNHHLGDAKVTPRSHMDIMGNIRRTVIEHNGIEKQHVIERLNTAIYDAYNMQYNGLTVQLEEYITSISIIDFIEVEFNPEIKRLNDELINNPNAAPPDIDKAHKGIARVLKEDPSLAHNAVARTLRHKLVREGSILQSVSARGFVKEVDSFQFPVPIKTGFIRGMNTYTAFATESRTATTAEFMTKNPMRKSEYLNRELQLLTSSVKRIHFGDCGSTESIIFIGPDKEHMKDLEGTHRFDKDGVEHVIRADDYHLAGKPLNIRSIWTCKHPDRYGLCSACYGELSNNIIPTDHIGHISAVEQQSDQSQLILSFKHFVNSVSLMQFDITDEAALFFSRRPKISQHGIFVKPEYKNASIVIYAEEGQNLDDLQYLDSLDKISENRFTAITSMGFIVGPPDKERRELVGTQVNNRTPFLTMDMLVYITQHGYTINEKGAYVIDLSEWDFDKPVLALPKKQFSAEEYSDLIKRFIKGTRTGKRKPTDSAVVTDFEHPDNALQEFHNIVSERLNVNLIHLQLILYGAMAYRPEEGKYNIPMPEDRRDGQFVKTSAKMKRGNYAVSMAYQTQIETLFDPVSYLQDGDRPTSEYDHILMGDSTDGTNN